MLEKFTDQSQITVHELSDDTIGNVALSADVPDTAPGLASYSQALTGHATKNSRKSQQNRPQNRNRQQNRPNETQQPTKKTQNSTADIGARSKRTQSQCNNQNEIEVVVIIDPYLMSTERLPTTNLPLPAINLTASSIT